MTIQTNPEAFNPNLPVQTVVAIDHGAGVITYDDGTQQPLSDWGHSIETQPVVGTQVQFRL